MLGAAHEGAGGGMGAGVLVGGGGVRRDGNWGLRPQTAGDAAMIRGRGGGGGGGVWQTDRQKRVMTPLLRAGEKGGGKRGRGGEGEVREGRGGGVEEKEKERMEEERERLKMQGKERERPKTALARYRQVTLSIECVLSV